MKLSTEAKVGSVTIAALLVLAYIIVTLGSVNIGDKGYQVQAVFSQVNGLKKGNLIRYAGVDIGKITDVKVLPDGVTVTCDIKPGIKIPDGAKFTIASDGLIGEKHIDIAPSPNSAGFLSPNATVRGQDILGFDQLIASSDQVLTEVHSLVKSLNDIIGDEKVKGGMKEAMINAKELTENLNRMSAILVRLAEANEGNINDMMGNLTVMTTSLRDVVGRVDGMLAGVDNHGQTANDLRETMENIRKTSARVEKMAAALEGVTTDPETAANLKETIKNARIVSDKANTMLGKFDAMNTQAGLEVSYNKQTNTYRTNGDVRVNTSPTDFAIIGVTGIGDDNKGNLQIGKSTAGLDGRVGIMDNKVGVGVDSHLNKDLTVSMDVYDPNNLRVKLRTEYQLSPNLFLVGQSDSINKQADQNTYVGIRQNF